MTQYSANDSLNLIQTSYIKKMETTGYLSNEDEVSLKKELDDAGIQNVSLNGTTFTKQAYGEPIELVITGEVNLSNSGVKNFKHFAGTVEFLQKKLKIERFGKFTTIKRLLVPANIKEGAYVTFKEKKQWFHPVRYFYNNYNICIDFT